MKWLWTYPVWLLLFAGLGLSCNNRYPETVRYEYHRITDVPGDSAIDALIYPYRAGIDSEMSEVICVLSADLERVKPGGSLGFWMADACRREASALLGIEVDACLLNYGGIRRPYLKAGPVKLGDLYELMPFDNELLVINMDGRQLFRVLQHAVTRGGEPVSGLHLTIAGDTLHNVRVNGIELLDTANYLLATNDYMYRGGDRYDTLMTVDRPFSLGLLRDALIRDLKEHCMDSLIPGPGLIYRYRYE